jgi:hypothetical protein
VRRILRHYRWWALVLALIAGSCIYAKRYAPHSPLAQAYDEIRIGMTLDEVHRIVDGCDEGPRESRSIGYFPPALRPLVSGEFTYHCGDQTLSVFVEYGRVKSKEYDTGFLRLIRARLQQLLSAIGIT